MKLSKLEQETIFAYNQEEKTATVYTCDKALIRRLDKLCLLNTEITATKTDDVSKTYLFPKKWIKVKTPRKLSEENRAKLKENALKNLGGAK